VLLEEGESRRFLGRRRVVDAAQDTGVESPPDVHGAIVPHTRITVSLLATQRDGLGHDVVGREDQIREASVSVLLDYRIDSRMILVRFADEGEEEARVEEDHSSVSP
jgi:hypothetical protein